MANLKVIVGCSVSFFGLLWLFFWKKSPKQKPPSDSTEEDIKQSEDTHRKLSNVGSKNNLPDVVHQSESESPDTEQEAVSETMLSNIEEVLQTESFKSGDGYVSGAQHADLDQDCVEEQIIQEEVLTSSSTAVTHSGNKTVDSLEYDMNCNGDNTRFSTSEYNSTRIAGSDGDMHRNSTMNEAFMTSDIGDSILNKTCEKPNDSTHDVSLSTSTFAEPLLESTKLDLTSCENDQSMRIECSVPLSADNNVTHNKKHLNGKKVCDNEKDKKDPFKNNQVSESDSVVNHVNSNHGDQMTSSWSSEVEGCDNVNRQADIELCRGDNSNAVNSSDSVGQTPSKTDSEASAHGSDSNTSNCDSVSSNCSSRASSIVDGPNKSNESKKESYEFSFPTQFCGRLIGKHGKNIQQLKERSGANISLSNHPFTPDFQICLVEGSQRQIDEALKVIGRKFPEVDLTAIGAVEVESEPEPSTNGKPLLMPDIMQLNLPEGVSIDVVVSSIVDAGHVFVQQHTHPSFPSLERLNQFMIACYTQDSIVPQLPRPLEVGVVCSAPMLNGWYRAQITAVYDDTDECDIKYVDYGGFSRVPGCTLRQIRSDFMTLPFQAVECYMANITPIQDEEYFSSEAAATLEELTQGKLLQAQIVGRSDDGTPYIHIYQIAGEKVVFVNRELVNRGVTRWMELMS